MITIFTPTYNRAYILPVLYQSLLRQTDKNFEWVIVDDGSSDNTEELVKNWIKEGKINSINYVKTTNQGKSLAINVGVQHAKGELFFIVDSDDYITDDAIEKIYKKQSSTNMNQNFKVCGFCFKKRNYNSNVDLTKFENEIPDFASSLELNYVYKQEQDKAEIFYTEVLKNYPFPFLKNTKFIPEAFIWFKIANDGYKFAISEDAIYMCEYIEDGYTRNMNNLIKNNNKGFALYYKSRLHYSEIPFIVKLKSLIRLIQCKIYGVFYK